MAHWIKKSFVALSLLLLSSCGVAFMSPTKDAAFTVPPAGKALVNFVRPSSLGYAVGYEVFDSEKLIGNTKGSVRFQYVCDPGEHYFLGRKERASVIKANLLAGKVYDVVVDIGMGWWVANITMDPITANHPRRGLLGEWDREPLYVLVDDEKKKRHEAKRQKWVKKTLNDFLQGEKRDRLKVLSAGDHR